MKRFITLSLILFMAMSLVACSGNKETAEEVKEPEMAYIEDTEFPVPDSVIHLKSKSSARTEGSGNGKYDYMITYTYENVGDAVIAHDEYAAYIDSHFPDGMDSLEHTIYISDPVVNEKDYFSVGIAMATASQLLTIDEVAGVYRVVSMDDELDEFLKNGWEDKSFYEYVVLVEDRADWYSVSHGEVENFASNTLQEFLEIAELTDNGFTINYEEGKIMVLEKTDEITVE